VTFDPTDLTIPELPEDLMAVPPPPANADDPDGDAKRAAWFAWRDAVLLYRRERWWLCGEETDGITGQPFDRAKFPKPEDDYADAQRRLELASCTNDPVYFLAVWCSLKETRNDAADEDEGAAESPGWLPAVPFGFQVAMVRWFDDRVRARRAGLVSKSRDMGATWLACIWALHGWLFKKAFTAKFISRSQVAVYSRSEDAMFSRVAAQFGYKPGLPLAPPGKPNPLNPLALPRWFWPQGFDPSSHMTELLLSNPANSNEINGEATSMRSGRGGRSTVVIVDEMAFVEDARHIFGTLRATAGSRIGISSESIEINDDFCEMAKIRRQSNDGSLIDLDYWLHPRHDRVWLEEQRRECEEDGNLDSFFREVLRDAAAGLGSWAYPYARDLTVGHFPYVHGAPIWVSIDPGYDDECAVHWFSRDPENPTRVRLIRSYVNRGQPPEFYAALIAGVREDGRADPGVPWYLRPSDEDAIEWVASLPVRPSLVYGDPAGGHNVAGKHSSWYDRMSVYWARHGWTKGVSYKGLGVDTRPFQIRRTSLMTLLPRLDFHDGPGVRETLNAIGESRFDQGEDRVTEQKTLRHDKFSHRRSAAEFFAVWHLKTEVLVDADWGVVRQKRKPRKAA
jgi:hypothetical protein